MVVVVVIVKGEEVQELEDIVMEELLERLCDEDATEPDAVSRGFLSLSGSLDCFSLNTWLESCEESEGRVFIISEGVKTRICWSLLFDDVDEADEVGVASCDELSSSLLTGVRTWFG